MWWGWQSSWLGTPETSRFSQASHFPCLCLRFFWNELDKKMQFLKQFESQCLLCYSSKSTVHFLLSWLVEGLWNIIKSFSTGKKGSPEEQNVLKLGLLRVSITDIWYCIMACYKGGCPAYYKMLNIISVFTHPKSWLHKTLSRHWQISPGWQQLLNDHLWFKQPGMTLSNLEIEPRFPDSYSDGVLIQPHCLVHLKLVLWVRVEIRGKGRNRRRILKVEKREEDSKKQ